MFIDRSEQGRPGEFANMSDEALEERLLSRLREGGLSERQARAFLGRQPRRAANDAA